MGASGSPNHAGLAGTGGSHVSFSLSVSLQSLPPWNIDSVTILICFLADLQTSPGSGPSSRTPMLVGVVQRSACWSASRSGCRCGSAAPGSRCRTSGRRCRGAWSTTIEFTPLSVSAPVEVLLAQTPPPEDALAVHHAVGVAARIAVRAAHLLRLGARIVDRRVEREQAVGPRAAAATDDERPGHRRRHEQHPRDDRERPGPPSHCRAS